MSLTPRELTVLALLADALTAVQIGRQLGISTRTVNKHVENLFRKMGTSDRLAAVIQAQAAGILTPTSNELIASRLLGQAP